MSRAVKVVPYSADVFGGRFAEKYPACWRVSFMKTQTKLFSVSGTWPCDFMLLKWELPFAESQLWSSHLLKWLKRGKDELISFLCTVSVEEAGQEAPLCVCSGERYSQLTTVIIGPSYFSTMGYQVSSKVNWNFDSQELKFGHSNFYMGENT